MKGAGGIREMRKEGREAGFPKWQEAGEKGKIMQHGAMLHSWKSAKRLEPTKLGRELGLKGMENGTLQPHPLLPSPLTSLPFFI